MDRSQDRFVDWELGVATTSTTIWAATVEHLRLTRHRRRRRLRRSPSVAGRASPLRLRWTYAPDHLGRRGALHHPQPGPVRASSCRSPASPTLTAEIGLVGYTLLILVRNIVAGDRRRARGGARGRRRHGLHAVAGVCSGRAAPGHAGDHRRAAHRHGDHRRPRDGHRPDRLRRLRRPSSTTGLRRQFTTPGRPRRRPVDRCWPSPSTCCRPASAGADAVDTADCRSRRDRLDELHRLAVSASSEFWSTTSRPPDNWWGSNGIAAPARGTTCASRSSATVVGAAVALPAGGLARPPPAGRRAGRRRRQHRPGGARRFAIVVLCSRSRCATASASGSGPRSWPWSLLALPPIFTNTYTGVAASTRHRRGGPGHGHARRRGRCAGSRSRRPAR